MSVLFGNHIVGFSTRRLICQFPLAVVFKYMSLDLKKGLQGFRPGLTQTSLYNHKKNARSLKFETSVEEDCL